MPGKAQNLYWIFCWCGCVKIIPFVWYLTPYGCSPAPTVPFPGLNMAKMTGPRVYKRFSVLVCEKYTTCMEFGTPY